MVRGISQFATYILALIQECFSFKFMHFRDDLFAILLMFYCEIFSFDDKYEKKKIEVFVDHQSLV